MRLRDTAPSSPRHRFHKQTPACAKFLSALGLIAKSVRGYTPEAVELLSAESILATRWVRSAERSTLYHLSGNTMALSSSGFKKLRANLLAHSKRTEVKLGNGLLIGLVNYSRHLGVSELSDSDTEKVLDTLGRCSLDYVAQRNQTPRIATGAALGHVLTVYGCGDAFGNCSRAAESILGGRKIEIEVFGERLTIPDNDAVAVEPEAGTAISSKYLTNY